MKVAFLLPAGTQTVAEVRTVIVHLGSRDVSLASACEDSENEFLVCVAGNRKR
jgi:acyl-CoA thioesterase FadM